MKKMISILMGVILCWSFKVTAQDHAGFQYVDPMPGANWVNRGTTIAIRPGQPVDKTTIPSDLFEVTGSISGVHAGQIKVAGDSRTIIFIPVIEFEPGEEVRVVVRTGLRTLAGLKTGALEFWFTVSPKTTEYPAKSFIEKHPGIEQVLKDSRKEDDEGVGFTLPELFPAIDVLINDSPDSGLIYLSNLLGTERNHLLILDDSGFPVFFREMTSRILDFKLQPTGVYTYNQQITFYVLDATFNIINTIQTGNGYTTDSHELLLLGNGNALLMSYDPQPVDMSLVVPKGDPNAVVTGLIIQELDAAENVIFQWRSWDHFEITDALGIDLSAPTIDYAHGNAIAVDLDGNLLISSRHMSEITKIHRNTGDIIWRLGGQHNEFTFTGIDTTKFSYQHAIRVLPNGNYTLFDNGNLHTPPFSRGVEYDVDTTNWTATTVWQYRESPDLFGPFIGFVQRLSNGNTLIDWGATNPNVTEVRPDGSKAYEMTFIPGVFSYRAFRLPSPGIAPAPFLWSADGISAGSFNLNFLKFGDSNVQYFKIYHSITSAGTTEIDSTVNNWMEYTQLNAGGRHTFRASAVNSLGEESPFSNTVTFEKEDPSGIEDVTSVVPKTHRLFPNYPNPFNPSTTIRFGLRENAKVTLSVYNINGQEIATLLDDVRHAGFHQVVWDGKNATGTLAGSGVYFCRLTAGKTVFSQKMLLLK